MTDKEKKPNPHFVPPPTRPPKTWHSRNLQKPAKKPEKTTAEVIEILERHIELMKTAVEHLTPGVPLSVVARPEVEALACIKRLQAQVQFVARKPKRTTCKECKHYHTTDCALWYGTLGDNQYFREHGGDFSCSWAERKKDQEEEVVTTFFRGGKPIAKRVWRKGAADGLSAKITVIDELHETKNHEEEPTDD